MGGMAEWNNGGEETLAMADVKSREPGAAKMTRPSLLLLEIAILGAGSTDLTLPSDF